MTAKEILVRAQHAMKISEYSLAEQLLKKILSVKPDYHLVHMLLGNVCERTGRLDEAEACYLESIRLKPDNTEALNNIGVVYKNQQKYEQALSCFIKALTIDPNRADIYYNIGNTYRDSGNLEAAAGQYEKAMKLNPGFVHAYTNLGMILEKQGKDEEAAYVYMQGLGIDYNNPRLHYNLGVIFERQGKPEKARKEYELALKAKPGWTDAMLNLGVVLSKLREHGRSIESFRTILRTEPDNIKAINNLGTEYGKLKVPEKAKKYYEKALEIDPEYGKAHLNLSSLYEEQGRLNDAVREIEILLSKNNTDIEAQLKLANLHVTLGKFRDAETGFRNVLKEHPGHKETLRCLGNLYLRTGKYKAANNCYEELAKNYPDTEKFRLDFALLLNDRKEFKKSEEEVKKFLSANPSDVDAESLLGELYFKQGYYDEAAELFEQIIGKNPNMVKPYYYLARTYKKTGKTGKALETIDKLITLEGADTSGHDIDNLNKAIKLYENATKEYEKELKITLGKDILNIEDFRFDEGQNGKSSEVSADQEKTDALYTADPTAAIIKTAGIEPVIPVKEQIEQIKIVEVVQENPAEKKPEVVELKDREGQPLTDLLNNEDLYDDMQSLKAKQAAHDRLMKELARKEKNQETAESGIDEPEFIKQPAVKKKKMDTHPPVRHEKADEDIDDTDEDTSKTDDDGDIDENAPVPPLRMKKRKAGRQKPRKEKRIAPLPPELPDDTEIEIPDIVNTDIELPPDRPDTPGDKILDSLKNIMDRIKAKVQFKPLPIFNLMPRRTGPEPEDDDGDIESLQKKTDTGKTGNFKLPPLKSTRQKLKEYFGNVRKKLDEDSGIKLPENNEKRKYIKNLVDKAIGETPIKKPVHDKKSESAEKKKPDNLKVADKKQTADKTGISEAPEKIGLQDEKKQVKKQAHYMGKLAAGTASTDAGKKEIFIKKKTDDISERFLVYAQPHNEKIDPSRELILEEKIVTEPPEEKKENTEKEKLPPVPENSKTPENKRKTDQLQEKQLQEKKLSGNKLPEKKQTEKNRIAEKTKLPDIKKQHINTGKTGKETETLKKETDTAADIADSTPGSVDTTSDSKSFKPHIRMKKDGGSRSLTVTTLKFLKLLSVCIPGKKIKNRIRSKLDSMIDRAK